MVGPAIGCRVQSDDEVGCLHGLPRWWRSGAAEHLEVAHERPEAAGVVEQFERRLAVCNGWLVVGSRWWVMGGCSKGVGGQGRVHGQGA